MDEWGPAKLLIEVQNDPKRQAELMALCVDDDYGIEFWFDQ